MKSSFVFFLLLCGMAECQIRRYIYISEKMNWLSAQRYCREKYTDLATITTDAENRRLMNASSGVISSDSWIGLNRTAPGSERWQWSDGESPHFFQWLTGQPNNFNGIQNCVKVESEGWNDYECSASYPFYCSWRFVLVKDSKTWEEALEYCRTYYTGLASPVSPEQLALAENAIAQTQTVSVWIGVRFVNGQWVCVNMAPLGSLVLLPSCPAPSYRCGAHNTSTNIWENRDCNEKLNFLCY